MSGSCQGSLHLLLSSYNPITLFPSDPGLIPIKCEHILRSLLTHQALGNPFYNLGSKERQFRERKWKEIWKSKWPEKSSVWTAILFGFFFCPLRRNYTLGLIYETASSVRKEREKERCYAENTFYERNVYDGNVPKLVYLRTHLNQFPYANKYIYFFSYNLSFKSLVVSLKASLSHKLILKQRAL